MPTFVKMDPKQVVLGRGRANAVKRRPFVDAIKTSQAGRILLEEGDESSAVKRLLRSASKEAGIKVRSSWEDGTRTALLWKRVAAKPTTAKQPAAKKTAAKGPGKNPIPFHPAQATG